MKDRYIAAPKSIYFKNTVFFLACFALFFTYMKLLIWENSSLMYFVNSILMVLFLLTSFKPKWGLYLLIFLIPLLNSRQMTFVEKPRFVIVFLFFGFFLGFIANFAGNIFKNDLTASDYGLISDFWISKAIIIFIIIVSVSTVVTIYRYSNFYPFLTNNYHNLDINLNGTDSTGSMIWTLRYFFNYLIGFLMFFVVINIISRIKDLLIALYILVFSTFLSSIFTIYQYAFNPLLGNSEHWANSGRFNGTFTDPNALGAYAILLFPLYIGIIVYLKKKYLKAIAIAAFALFLLIPFLSGSRSAFIGIVFSIIFLSIAFITRISWFLKGKFNTFPKLKRNIIMILIVLILVAVAAVIIYMFAAEDTVFEKVGLLDRLIDTFKTGTYYFNKYGIAEGLKSISNYRYILWDQALEMFGDYPVSGVGQGSYLLQLPNYLKMNWTNFYQVDYAGNYYLQVLSELGLTGLIANLFIFFLLINRVYRYYRFNRKRRIFFREDWILITLFISFFSMLVGQIFGPHTNFDEVQLTFWLIIGLMFSYIFIAQKTIPYHNRPSYVSRKVRFSLVEKIILTAIVLIFLVSFVHASLTSLSINESQNMFDVKGNYEGWENKYGFYNEENVDGKVLRWTEIDASEVLEKKGDKLVIPMRDAMPVEGKEPLSVKIFINSILAEKVTLAYDEWQRVEIDLPESTADRFTITFALNRTWSPVELGINSDSRELGVQIGEYEFY